MVLGFQLLAAAALGFLLTGCETWNRMMVKMSVPDTFSPVNDPAELKAAYDGPDAAREIIPVHLYRVASGFNQPTDIQFVPRRDDVMVVLEKTGAAHWVNFLTRKRGELLHVGVTADSEQGLLGLAFHPQFHKTGRLFVYYTTRKDGREISRLSAWKSGLTDAGALLPATGETVLLEVGQPYANHNGGQIFFSPEGYLFIALGDGGLFGDPHENGQNPGTLLGALLRIDVDSPQGDKPYGIPRDNPFVDQPGARPEVYAIGLRNPWRASLDQHGRVVVGDVGQESREEITIVEAGKNYGWNIREGTRCYKPARNCRTEGLVPPIYEYTHGEAGQSVTGGYVYLADRIPQLRGLYVFGDFISGRLWALPLPESATGKAETIFALGQWPIIPSTFGRNNTGDVFVADFSSGVVFLIGPPEANGQAED